MGRIVPVAVPKWGIEMQEGSFLGWRVPEGTLVHRGDQIAEMETEKIANVLEAPADGVLKRCIAQEGETLAVGHLLGIIADADTSDAEIDAFIASYATASPGEATVPKTDAGAVVTAQPETVRVSVAARNLAEKLGVDLRQVKGSGRRGRIMPADVERAARGGTERDDAGYTVTRMSATRRTISNRLLEAKRKAPKRKGKAPARRGRARREAENA